MIDERANELELKLNSLEIQVRVLGNQLAEAKERTRRLEDEIRILKEGGNL